MSEGARSQESEVRSQKARLRFFVSRAGGDAEIAEWIAKALEAEGHQVTIQNVDDFVAGSFPHHIRTGIDDADRFIAVYSPSYFKSDFCLAELYAAFARDPIGEYRFLVPVLVEPCKVPGLF